MNAAHRIDSIDYSHDIRPYLQLPHLLSLTWLAYPILSLIFIVFRLQLSSGSAQDAVANAKEDLLASCKAAEHAATSTASMPRYLAIASNHAITDAVNGTMNGARATMVLALTIMEAIINFIIDIWRSTFLCFVELVVRGALSILIGAVDEINSLLSSTFNSIRTSIQNDLSTLNSAIQGFVKTYNDVPLLPNINIPNISVPSLSSLQNVTLPSDFTTALQKLNDSLPTIAELKNGIEDIVDTPFELVKKDINDTFTGLTFDVNALPVPQMNTVTFCDQMDTSVIDDLGRDLVKAVKIGTVILIVLIFLLILANCALEWYKWRQMKLHFNRIREGLDSDPDVVKSYNPDGRMMVGMSDHDLMSIEGTMSHPLIAKIVNKLEVIFGLRKAKKDKLIWFFHYVFHPPALACFLIGVFGLLSVQLQLIAIGPLQAHYQQQAASSVSDFSTLIATSMNQSMYNDSVTYANDVNSRVDHVQSTINDGMFGWVNGTTTTLNDTINTFYTDVQNVVNSVFGNTILEEPVQEFIRCFLGSKVDAIENALTFLHDNLHVDIPRVNDTVLMLSPQSIDEATQPIAQAAIGTGNGDDNDGLVGRIINVYVKSLKQERIMFAIFAGLWLFVVFMALCILFWDAYGRALYRKVRGRGGGDGSDPYSGKEQFFHPEKMVKSPGVSERGSAPSFPPIGDPRLRKFWSLNKAFPRVRSRSEPTTPPPPPQEEEKKSWDAILDHAASSPVEDKPNKLRTFFAKLKKGKTQTDDADYVRDSTVEIDPWFPAPPQEPQHPMVPPPLPPRPSPKTAPAPQQTQPSTELPYADDPFADFESSTDPRPRVDLSIVTNPALVRPQGLPATEPPTAPWMDSIQPVRPLPGVPHDVSASARSSAMPVPLYYGYDAPAPAPASLEARAVHLRPPPFHAHPRTVDPDTSTPITRHLNTNHARKSSQAVDPFVTPFDDEYGVRPRATPPGLARASAGSNPFLAVAV